MPKHILTESPSVPSWFYLWQQQMASGEMTDNRDHLPNMLAVWFTIFTGNTPLYSSPYIAHQNHCFTHTAQHCWSPTKIKTILEEHGSVYRTGISSSKVLLNKIYESRKYSENVKLTKNSIGSVMWAPSSHLCLQYISTCWSIMPSANFTS